MQTSTMHMRKTPQRIRVLDSTLREGEQHPGVSFTNKTKNSDCLDARLFWGRSN